MISFHLNGPAFSPAPPALLRLKRFVVLLVSTGTKFGHMCHDVSLILLKIKTKMFTLGTKNTTNSYDFVPVVLGPESRSPEPGPVGNKNRIVQQMGPMAGGLVAAVALACISTTLVEGAPGTMKVVTCSEGYAPMIMRSNDGSFYGFEVEQVPP